MSWNTGYFEMYLDNLFKDLDKDRIIYILNTTFAYTRMYDERIKGSYCNHRIFHKLPKFDKDLQIEQTNEMITIQFVYHMTAIRPEIKVVFCKKNYDYTFHRLIDYEYTYDNYDIHNGRVIFKNDLAFTEFLKDIRCQEGWNEENSYGMIDWNKQIEQILFQVM